MKSRVIDLSFIRKGVCRTVNKVGIGDVSINKKMLVVSAVMIGASVLLSQVVDAQTVDNGLFKDIADNDTVKQLVTEYKNCNFGKFTGQIAQDWNNCLAGKFVNGQFKSLEILK